MGMYGKFEELLRSYAMVQIQPDLDRSAAKRSLA